MSLRRVAVFAGICLAVAGCFSSSERVEPASAAIVAGAGFSTFDSTIGGCVDSPNGIDCNHYVSKESVYMSGGPGPSGVSDGDFFFAVLTPGSQNGGFVDGADGNLSDTTVGSTVGDAGGGDDVSNRTFHVSGHQIDSYTGTHAIGTSPNGRFIIGLAPFDDTDNPGGVYILAICRVGATSPSDCKYDAFHVRTNEEEPPHVFGVVRGMKYYDANANGAYDAGEAGIAGWPIDFHDGVSGTVYTDAGGAFELSLVSDTYSFAEQVAGNPWMHTGNVVDQTSITGGASASLLADKTYELTVVDDSTIDGVYFGNLCLGAGGGLTLGFWSNKNGQALTGADDRAMLSALNLRTASGGDFDPATNAQLRSWLLSANAVNMAYMLSAQFAAASLNVYNGFVSGTALVYAPGTTSASALGFATMNDLLAEANAALGADGYTPDGDPSRAYQEAIKNALDRANNNLNFVQASPATCPAPVF